MYEIKTFLFKEGFYLRDEGTGYPSGTRGRVTCLVKTIWGKGTGWLSGKNLRWLVQRARGQVGCLVKT